MSRSKLGLFVLFLCSFAVGAEVQETVASAYRAFLEGRLDDATSGFKYLATLGISVPDPESNLAVISRDKGDNDVALAQWVKSSLQEGADGFVWNQRAWAYVSADRPKEARESFEKAIERSSTTASQAEANIGLGLSALLASQPKKGMEALRSALVQGPYAISAASLATAQVALAVNDKQAALAYLRQSLDTDPLNLDALKTLAALYDKIGENRSAWRAYRRVLQLDPDDAQAAARLKKLAEYIQGDPEAALAIRRIGRPVLDRTVKPFVEPGSSTPTVRVAIFSLEDARPATATRLYFVANGDFKVIAQSGETVKDDGHGQEQWEVSFRAENNVVEVRDASHNLLFTTKQRFRIVPTERAGTTLLKSGVFNELIGFDRGDRELRGVVEFIPTPYGFKTVNELPVEDYLFGAVGSALPEHAPLEAFKAVAVVSRTLALWARGEAPKNLEGTNICDNGRAPACMRYLGVSEEMRESSAAVGATEGMVLSKGDRAARVAQHDNCGGVTESGKEAGEAALAELESVDDAPAAGLPPRTPVQLERWTHEYPPRDRYCEASGLPQTYSRWIRIVDAKDVKARVDRIKNIGGIRRLRALRRTSTGRVRALEIVGSRETLVVEGADAIERVLSPGSLRSTLFTITPLMKGGYADRFILWGAGSGSGLGLCRAGAMGQAALGRDYKSILAVYFPHLKTADAYKPPPPPAAKKAPGKYGRPLNPKRAKPVKK